MVIRICFFKCWLLFILDAIERERIHEILTGLPSHAFFLKIQLQGKKEIISTDLSLGRLRWTSLTSNALVALDYLSTARDALKLCYFYKNVVGRHF